MDIENKLYKANKTSLELIRLLKEAESENEQLQREKEFFQREVADLKKRFELYIPVKGDAIDMRLAEYINNYPDRSRLKIMFQRESEGVYLFGTKRVNIRVDNNNINVRVGGGYLSIDEFIEQYTPSEVERMLRMDPSKKFSDRAFMLSKLPPMNVTGGELSPRSSMIQNQSIASIIPNSGQSPIRKSMTKF